MSEDKSKDSNRKPTPSDSATPPGAPTPQQLKNALKAFKKRLKLTRLDDESRLGRGATTSGGKSDIVAIVPPSQYPQAVWDELTRQGKLRRARHGLYELVGQ